MLLLKYLVIDDLSSKSKEKYASIFTFVVLKNKC